jgi:hypothetical protein
VFAKVIQPISLNRSLAFKQGYCTFASAAGFMVCLLDFVESVAGGLPAERRATAKVLRSFVPGFSLESGVAIVPSVV